jgi:enterochelin esterase-like enzyme
LINRPEHARPVRLDRGIQFGRARRRLRRTFPALDSKANAQLHLLWIACGTDDRLIEPNRKFREFLKSKDIRFTPIETPGAHNWMVWRRNLAEFGSLLFQEKRQ